LVATNSVGNTLGGDFTVTPPLLPSVTTLAATSVSATNATLNGTVNPGGGATTAYFQYGLTKNYGSYTATNSLAATNTTLSVSNLISSLSLGTTYHFQLVAINSAGTSRGGDMSFTTTKPNGHKVVSIEHASQSVNFILSGSIQASGGAFQLAFTNLSGLSVTVLGSTNLALPLTNWTVLGSALESPAGSGNYQFTDLHAATKPGQFYRVRSP
jgi:hypothetical protein